MNTTSVAIPARAKTNAVSVRTFYWLLVAPALVAMLAFYFFPLARVLWISVTEPRPGLDNYTLLLTSASVHNVLLVTARICVITTTITLVLGYVVAYAMVHARGRQLRWLTFFVLLPLWVSVLVRAFAWVTLLRSNGLVNQALLGLGVVAGPLPLVRNEFGVAVGMIHYMIPFAVLPLYANMQGIDLRLVAAARGLGASRGQAFRRVVLPLSLPGLVGAGVLVFIFSLGFYVTPAILGGGRVPMISNLLDTLINQIPRWDQAAAISTILLIVTLLIFAAYRRFDRRAAGT